MATNIAAMEILDQFGRDTLYVERNREKWLDEYSDCWVVVYREKLISHADTFDEALSKARVQGLQGSNMVIERITREPISLIL